MIRCALKRFSKLKVQELFGEMKEKRTMMRFSNLRNAVLAFMLAFTAACSTGGDTTPAGPGSDNTTGDASVAGGGDVVELYESYA